MYHYKARTYSPTLGRFLQTDPIGYGDGMNVYAYAHADPVNGSDPSGLSTDTTGTHINCQNCGPNTAGPPPASGGVTVMGNRWADTEAFVGALNVQDLVNTAVALSQIGDRINNVVEEVVVVAKKKTSICKAVAKLPAGFGVYVGAQITAVPGWGFSDAVKITYVSDGHGGAKWSAKEEAFNGGGLGIFGGITIGAVVPNFISANGGFPFKFKDFAPRGGLKAAFGLGGDLGDNNIGLAIGLGYSPGIMQRPNKDNSDSRDLAQGSC